MAQEIPLCFGAEPDSPDSRDFLQRFEAEDIPTVEEVNLWSNIGHVPWLPYSQMPLESCTANAVCAAYTYDLIKQHEIVTFNPSRLFLYYNTRVQVEKRNPQSKTASLRDTVKAMSKIGVCLEDSWKYDAKQVAMKPSAQCYKEAEGNKIKSYHRIDQSNDINQLRACLNAGSPFVFSFIVYPSFYQAPPSGVVPVPTASEKAKNPHPPGHACVAVGYNDKSKTIRVLNSWGKNWGDNGFFYMPYDYITNRSLCYDFWKIEFVQEKWGARAATGH